MQGKQQPTAKPHETTRSTDFFDLQQNQREFDRGQKSTPHGACREKPQVADNFRKSPRCVSSWGNSLLPAAAESAVELHHGLELIAARLGQSQLLGEQ